MEAYLDKNDNLVIVADDMLEAIALRQWQDRNMAFARHHNGANAVPYWRFERLTFKTPDLPEPRAPRTPRE